MFCGRGCQALPSRQLALDGDGIVACPLPDYCTFTFTLHLLPPPPPHPPYIFTPSTISPRLDTRTPVSSNSRPIDRSASKPPTPPASCLDVRQKIFPNLSDYASATCHTRRPAVRQQCDWMTSLRPRADPLALQSASSTS